MSKRYVFWRNANGKPSRGIDDNRIPSKILEIIGMMSSLNENGGITWKGHYIEYEQILKEYFAVVDGDDLELNAEDAWSIMYGALIETIKKNGGKCPIKGSELIWTADTLAADYFRQKSIRYLLVSSLSVASFPGKSIRMGDCEIRPLKKPMRVACKLKGNELTLLENDLHQHLSSSQYQVIQIETMARSRNEAVQKGLRSVDLLRGIWMLITAHRSWRIQLAGRRKDPLGAIHKGPIHILCEAGRKPVENPVWCESDCIPDQKLYEPGGGWANAEKCRRRIMRKIKLLPYRRDLEELIIRYAEALGFMNLHQTYLHLWGILERITDTVGGKYDETIRRTSFTFKDRELVKEMLEAARLNRNRYIHSGNGTISPDQISYLVKSFIDPHLLRLINNESKAQSVEEYGRFLALPMSLTDLKKQQSFINRAVKTIERWNETKKS